MFIIVFFDADSEFKISFLRSPLVFKILYKEKTEYNGKPRNTFNNDFQFFFRLVFYCIFRCWFQIWSQFLAIAPSN